MNRTRSNFLCGIGLIILLWVVACPLFAQLSLSVSYGPPALPLYGQPACPEQGYMWTPGYWAWDPDYGYYWVPGTWILAPQAGYLWTPPWWGWNNGSYIFHEGYWGSQVGFYGGINYGFGYYGNGFEGGRWQGDRFFYNRSVMNVNLTEIHNVYNSRIVNRGVNSRVSYNGGVGGLTARPTTSQRENETGRHLSPVAAQLRHRQQARGNPDLRASANRGKPPIAATARPTSFSGRGVVAAREAGAPYHAPANERGARPIENAVENHPAETRKGSKPALTAARQPEASPREARRTEMRSREPVTTITERRSVNATHAPGNVKETRSTEKAVDNHLAETPKGRNPAHTTVRQPETNPREARRTETRSRKPVITTTERRSVNATHTPTSRAPEERPASAPAAKRPAARPIHASELPRHEAPATHANSTAEEQRIHGQQEKLAAKQNQEHQTLARQQTREDQRAEQKTMQAQQRQQNEVRHQQQTQQMEQRHAAQTNNLTEHPAPAKPATHENGKPREVEKPH